jgi:hypothetical protein
MDPKQFAIEVRAERARLAIIDQADETAARRPLTLLEGIAVLANATTAKLATLAPRTGVHSGDDDLIDRLGLVGDHGRRTCPAHNSRGKSLAWKINPDGKLLVKCFAGCTFDEIRAAA